MKRKIFFSDHTLVINSESPVVKKVMELSQNAENKEKVTKLANHIYDLALMAQNNLKGERMIEFIKDQMKY